MEGQHILAIEHDWRMRKLIRANLEAVGLEVQEAVSAQHGLALIRHSRPALILLDLDMPGVDAWRMLEEVEAQFSGQPAPVIVMSGEPLERWLRQHELAGRHVQKPFAISNLLEQVRAALEDAEEEKGKPGPGQATHT